MNVLGDAAGFMARLDGAKTLARLGAEIQLGAIAVAFQGVDAFLVSLPDPNVDTFDAIAFGVPDTSFDGKRKAFGLDGFHEAASGNAFAVNRVHFVQRGEFGGYGAKDGLGSGGCGGAEQGASFAAAFPEAAGEWQRGENMRSLPEFQATTIKACEPCWD